MGGFGAETKWDRAEPAETDADTDAEAPDPDDEVFLLGERIADFTRCISVAEHEVLTLLVDTDGTYVVKGHLERRPSSLRRRWRPRFLG